MDGMDFPPSAVSPTLLPVPCRRRDADLAQVYEYQFSRWRLLPRTTKVYLAPADMRGLTAAPDVDGDGQMRAYYRGRQVAGRDYYALAEVRQISLANCEPEQRVLLAEKTDCGRPLLLLARVVSS